MALFHCAWVVITELYDNITGGTAQLKKVSPKAWQILAPFDTICNFA
jgi:hypothetical protein